MKQIPNKSINESKDHCISFEMDKDNAYRKTLKNYANPSPYLDRKQSEKILIENSTITQVNLYSSNKMNNLWHHSEKNINTKMVNDKNYLQESQEPLVTNFQISGSRRHLSSSLDTKKDEMFLNLNKHKSQNLSLNTLKVLYTSDKSTSQTP